MAIATPRIRQANAIMAFPMPRRKRISPRTGAFHEAAHAVARLHVGPRQQPFNSSRTDSLMVRADLQAAAKLECGNGAWCRSRVPTRKLLPHADRWSGP